MELKKDNAQGWESICIWGDIDLQLEGDDLTCPPFYRFTDYLDLLNEWIHALRDIVNWEKTSKTWFRESIFTFVQRGWYFVLSLSLKNYYLWTHSAVPKAENVLCWTALYFLQTWQVCIPLGHYRWRGYWTDVPCFPFEKGSFKIA